MRCVRCGNFYKADDRFCGFCGYNLSVSTKSDFVTMHALNVRDLQYDLGLVYYKKGKYEEALDIFETVHKRDPENLEVKKMCEQARQAIDRS